MSSIKQIRDDRQRRLIGKLHKEFYEVNEIIDILCISYKEFKSLKLKKTDNGYKKIDIIIAKMGGIMEQTL